MPLTPSENTVRVVALIWWRPAAEASKRGEEEAKVEAVEAVEEQVEAEVEVMAAQRSLTGAHPGLWEFPGGKVESGESDKQALQREIGEELGVELKLEDLIFFSENQWGRVRLVCYLSPWSGQGLILKEHQDFVWASPQSLLNYSLAPADIPIMKKLLGFRGK